MDDLKDFCCLNPACSAYGTRGGANLRVAFRYGPGKRRRLLACRTCQHRFSERAGTPLFDCRLPEAKAVDVLAHLQEGVGVRKTSRLTGVNKNTVVRLALQAGRHARQRHDELVAFSPSDP
jgi:transposase-like protein